MFLPELCIKRPVFTIVLSLIIIALGSIFFFKLPIRSTPNVNPPVITVVSSYPGSDALYMERQITQRIEDALKTTKNLKTMSSTSSVGTSVIVMEFDLDADIEIALNDARSTVSDITKILPADMQNPIVSKFDSDAWPSLWISVNSSKHDDLELTRISDNQIKSVLEKLPTVGDSRIYGAREYSMMIKPINKKMFQHKISPFELENLIKTQNRDYPAGSIQTNDRNFSIKLSASLNTREEFENIIVKKYKDGTIIKLKDVANVSLEPFDSDIILRYNGSQSLAVGLVKQSTANIIELSNSVREALPNIKQNLPPGVNVAIAYDAAIAVKASINSVYITIFEAIALVGLVTYIFLGSLKITLIPLVAIPISLIGTFAAMYLLNFSINIFTLLAMILAIGLVVDDAIVMLENIFRHNYELGKKPVQASVDASKEIGFAVIAMTITLASVFLPIGLIDGFLGKLFIEFAWTLAFAVLISGFVALTLTPMMTSRMIDSEKFAKAKFLEQFDHYFKKLQNSYSLALRYTIENKTKFYLLCLFSIVVLIISIYKVDKTFLPDDDGGFLQVFYTGPEGSNKEQSLKSVIESEKILAKRDDILGFFEVVGFGGGGDNAMAFVPLVNWSNRKKSHTQIKNELNQEFSKIPGMSVFAISPPSIGGGRGSSDKAVNFNIQTSLGYDELDQVSAKFVKIMQNNPVFRNVERDYKASTPTLDIIVNREKAYRYGADIESIGKTIQYLISGKEVGDFRIGNDIYKALIRYDKKDRNEISDLQKIFIKTNENKILPIESVVDLIETITIKEYKHYNNARAIQITADISPNETLDNAANEVEKIASKIIDPTIAQLNFSGQIKQMRESGGDTIYTFIFALIFIYLVLSAQFESFTDPLLILMAVPFSITGGILTLLIFSDNINMYSNIGLVTLIGLVTKNSIMIVEFTNQLRAEGKKITDAIIEAANLRLRPILMTSIATICGAIPLILASGAGGASRNSIGLVIVGGMLIGTLFTIFVIPVLYQTFKRESKIVK